MSERTGMSVRELALELLLEMEKSGGPFGNVQGSVLLRSVLDKYDYMEQRDKAFLKRLTEGVTERRIQLDYVLELFSKTPVPKMKPVIRILLRMGVYQILFMESVPDAAACNETVKLAAKRHFGQLRGFVNGVLRTVSREKERIKWPDPVKEPIRRLSVLYSMPEWIVERWLEHYGAQTTEKMLSALLEKRPVTIRLSESLDEGEKEKLLSALAERGAKPKAHPLLPYAYTLEKSDGIARLPGFAEGFFTVQDVSSMLVAEAASFRELARNQEDSFVMDVCAAPGGKAVHAAQCLGERGSVLASDLSEYKADYIRDNARRMRLSNLTVRVRDASVLDEPLKERADVVLADLPCSGLGVIGRKPDIKYRVSPESIAQVAMLQRKILSTVWQYVKPGGLLVYSTCTVTPEENEDMADWILTNLPFEPVPLPARPFAACCSGPETSGGTDGESRCAGKAELPSGEAVCPYYCQLLPGVHPTDGFFISCFRRKRTI